MRSYDETPLSDSSTNPRRFQQPNLQNTPNPHRQRHKRNNRLHQHQNKMNDAKTKAFNDYVEKEYPEGLTAVEYEEVWQVFQDIWDAVLKVAELEVKISTAAIRDFITSDKYLEVYKSISSVFQRLREKE